jgi:peptidoglycan/LPS O-acetylase OafA/YrhL
VKARRANAFLRVAALLALLGLAFMVWSVLQPTPMPVILAMSVGQGIGTLSFLIYLFVVIADLRRKKVLEAPPE